MMRSYIRICSTACFALLIFLPSVALYAAPQSPEDIVRKSREAVQQKATATEAPQKTPSTEKGEEDPFEGLPQTGTLASYGSGVGSQVAGGFGSVALSDDKPQPLSASIQKRNDRWFLTIKNSSDKHVTLNLQLKQFNKLGTKIKNNYISASLGPKESTERSVPSGIEATQVVAELTSWRAS